MMKFFRKYNKHLLAVFMALLLVIWLGGTALESMFAPDFSKTIIGKADTGPVTQGDTERAEHQSRLQSLLGLSWQRAYVNPGAPADEQLSNVEWILLVREAERYGIRVSPAQARARLAGNRDAEQAIRRLAARRDVDVPVDAIYQAAAQYFSVSAMLGYFSSSLLVPEPMLRVLARDVFEQATVEVVEIPAESFADPEETFTDEEYAAQFEKHKEDKGGRGGLNFGYYIDPAVRVEYISIDPTKIKDQLRGGESAYERRAYNYWKNNRDSDRRFSRTAEQIAELQKQQEDANTNGADATTNGEGPNPTPAPIAPFFETFAEAREQAIDIVKEADAVAEADRIATVLSRLVAEPWFDVAAASNGFKPAPDSVKSSDYMSDILTKLPANLQYPGAVTAHSLDWMNARELAEVDGFGEAGLEIADGGRLGIAQLAFNVEGLVTIPEDSRIESSLYLAKWQTLTKPIESPAGSTYVFRVVDVRDGHVPSSVDEVRDRVATDLRLLRGMERAKEAASAFADTVGTNSLRVAWEGAEELSAKVTPDDGGYLPFVQSFGRDMSRVTGVKNRVLPLGEVTDEFVEKSFELVTDLDADKVAVVELPNQGSMAVIKGKAYRPLYEEDYQARRDMLRQQLLDQSRRELLLGSLLNAKHVRERNGYKRAQ